MSNITKNGKEDRLSRSLEIKTAQSLNAYPLVASPADIKDTNTFVYRLLTEAEPYQEIVKDLKRAGSKGLINFVDNNEYKPLVELILKYSFPPSELSVYGSDRGRFGIDLTYYGADGPQRDPGMAVMQLRRVLFGSIRKWGDEDLDDIQDLFGFDMRDHIGLSQEQIVDPASGQMVPNPMVVEMQQYQEQLSRTQTLEQTIQENRKKLRENDALSDISDDPSSEKLDPEVRDRIEKSLRILEARYRQELAGLDIMASRLAMKHGNEEYLRNDDGFDKFDPLKEISEILARLSKKSFRAVVRAKVAEKEKEIKQKSAQDVSEDEIYQTVHFGEQAEQAKDLMQSFLRYLYHYPSTDPKLNEYKSQVVEMAGGFDADNDPANGGSAVSPLKGYLRCFLGRYEAFKSLMMNFNARAKKQGKLLVLSGVEGSAICSEMDSDDNFIWGAPDIFDSFITSNEAKTSYAVTKIPQQGERIVIIHTHAPLANFKGVTVPLEKILVDDKIAEIIISSFLDQHYHKVLRNYKLKRTIEIKESPFSNEDKKSQIRGLDKEAVDGVGHSLVNAYIHKTLCNLIVGHGLTRAVDLIRNALDNAVIVTDDSDDATSSYSIDGNAAVSEIRSIVNKEAFEGARGLQRREVRIVWQDYARSMESDWGAYVNTMIRLAHDVKIMRFEIEECENESAELMADIKFKSDERRLIAKKSDLSDKELKKAMTQVNKEIATLRACIKENKGRIKKITTLLNTVMGNMAHLVCMYGPPGTGKSIWPEVFAEMMGFDLWTINIRDTLEKWVGSSGENLNKVTESILKSRDIVILLDEFDKQVGKGGDGQQQHSTEKNIIKELQEFLEERVTEFQKRGIFIFLATNYPDEIEEALKERMDLFVKVPRLETPEEYAKLITSFINVRKGKSAYALLADIDVDITDTDAWETTQKLFDQITKDKSVLMQIAKGFADNNTASRNVIKTLATVFAHHGTYLAHEAAKRGREKLGDKIPSELLPAEYADNISSTGMPMFPAVFIRAAEMARNAEVDGKPINGANRLLAYVNKLRVRGKTEEEIKVDLERGTISGDDEDERQMELFDELPGTHEDKIKEETEEIEDTDGMVGEEDLAKGKANLITEELETTSTTDYFYSFLKKNGFVETDEETDEETGEGLVEPPQNEENRGQFGVMDTPASDPSQNMIAPTPEQIVQDLTTPKFVPQNQPSQLLPREANHEIVKVGDGIVQPGTFWIGKMYFMPSGIDFEAPRTLNGHPDELTKLVEEGAELSQDQQNKEGNNYANK